MSKNKKDPEDMDEEELKESALEAIDKVGGMFLFIAFAATLVVGIVGAGMSLLGFSELGQDFFAFGLALIVAKHITLLLFSKKS